MFTSPIWWNWFGCLCHYSVNKAEQCPPDTPSTSPCHLGWFSNTVCAEHKNSLTGSVSSLLKLSINSQTTLWKNYMTMLKKNNFLCSFFYVAYVTILCATFILWWGVDGTYLSHRQPGRGLWHTGQSPTWTQTARSNPGKRGKTHYIPGIFWNKFTEKSSCSYSIIWYLWQLKAGNKRVQGEDYKTSGQFNYFLIQDHCSGNLH